MQTKFKLYGYKTVCVVAVIFLTIHLWIGGYLFKSTTETEKSGVPNLVQKQIFKNGKTFDYKRGRLPGWEERSLLPSTANITLQKFRQILTRNEFNAVLEILRTFKSVCEKNGLIYMLYGGSAFGAYRHAGFIPWDDDVDVWMDAKQMNGVSRILGKLSGFNLFKVEDKPNLWKLMKNDSNLNKWDNCKNELFPFIHIIFYTDNSTHIRDIDSPLTKKTVFPRSDIFPLKKVLFEDDEYFVPNNVLAMMTRRYGRVDMCTPRTCSNSTISVPCDLLYPYFPFIIRSEENGSLVERLMFDDKIIWEKVTNK